MPPKNPFQKAHRGRKFVKLLISGGSGGGKTLTAIQVACHMATAIGRPGSVAVIDTEDGSAGLYSHDDVLDEPYYCGCEQCAKGSSRMALEFDHLDLRDHSPQEFMRNMDAATRNGYAVLVLDSASHEWCGVNGCLEQVDVLKGDGRGRKTDDAWNKVGQLHTSFLQKIRSIEIHLLATCRTKPGRGDDKGAEIVIQREKDGPFYYEFGFWATLSRSAPGSLHVAKSRSGHFQGEVWKKAGKHVAEQFMLWGGHLQATAPQPAATDVDEVPVEPVDLTPAKDAIWARVQALGDPNEIQHVGNALNAAEDAEAVDAIGSGLAKLEAAKEARGVLVAQVLLWATELPEDAELRQNIASLVSEASTCDAVEQIGVDVLAEVDRLKAEAAQEEDELVPQKRSGA